MCGEMNAHIISLKRDDSKRSGKFKKKKKKNKPYSTPSAAVEESTNGNGVQLSCDIGSADPAFAGCLARQPVKSGVEADLQQHADRGSGSRTSEAELLARFQAAITDDMPRLDASCMDYLEYGDQSKASNEDDDQEALILALLDDNMSPDEIDRRFGKNACRNALEFV